MSSSSISSSSHPIDHGYAWVICLGSFFINLMVSGSLRSAGIVYVEVIETLHYNASMVSFSMAFMGFGYAVFTLGGTGLGKKTSMRTSCLIGAVLSFIAMFFTSIVPHIAIVIIFFGLVGGASYGFLQGPSLISIAQYFDKRRALAVSIGASGGSVGTLLIPQFLRATIDSYGFRGAMLLYAAMALHTIPAAMLLRPPSFFEPKRRNEATQTKPSDHQLSQWSPVDYSDDTSNEEQELRSHHHDVSEVTTIDSDRNNGDAINGLTSKLSTTLPTRPSNSRRESTGSLSDVYIDDDGRVKLLTVEADVEPPHARGGAEGGISAALIDRYLGLLRSWTFIFFTISLTFGQSDYFSAFFFMPSYLHERWQSKVFESTFITVVGVSDIVGRISGGWFADLHIVGLPTQMGASLLVLGTSTFLVPLVHNKTVMLVYAVVLGGVGGAFQGLITTVLAHLFGLELLPTAFGLSHLVLGFTMLLLPPAMGKIQVLTGTYSFGMYVVGGLLAFAGVASCLVPLMSRIDKRRYERHQGLHDGLGVHQPLRQSSEV